MNPARPVMCWRSGSLAGKLSWLLRCARLSAVMYTER
jgi:hypothetical protein